MARQITQSEFDKRKKELDYLKNEGRTEIALKLQEARSHGDLSENDEYDEARNDQAKLEEKIARLAEELDNVEVVPDDYFEHGIVHVGSVVEVEDAGEIIKVIIDATSEDDDILSITQDSPVGAALIGKKAGDKIKVTLPSDEVVTMKIISTEYQV